MANHHVIHISLLYLFCACTICAFSPIKSIADSSQEVEFSALRSFVMPDNDISFDKNPEGKIVKIPEAVRAKISSLTSGDFDIHESVVFQIALPKNNRLLFVLIDRYSCGNNAYDLMLFDPNTSEVTDEPVVLPGSAMDKGDEFLEKPFISFDDIDKDGRAELTIQERVRCGTECDWVVYHYYQVNPDLSLGLVFDRTTNIVDHSGGVRCMITKKLRKISKGKIKLKVIAKKDNSRPMTVGEIIYSRKNMDSPFKVVSYFVSDKHYAFYVNPDVYLMN